jgi:outer membrane protein assembly factor BamB
MTSTTINELHKALGLEFSLVTRVWDYKAKDWVTGVFAVDIDDDGELEVIASSRDGRLHLLSARGDCKWERIIGSKTWVGTLAVGNPSTRNLSIGEKDTSAHIIVGTRDGKVYVFDKDGRTISKEGKTFAFDSNGMALDPVEEQKACWYDTGYVIRQVYVDPVQPTDIIFGSEDRYVYVLDYQTGELRWKYQTNGWVRAVFSYDLNGDGEAEVLVGSGDKNIYLFNQQGQVLAQYNMGHAIQRIIAADVDDDGQIEILVGTAGKDLAALVYYQDENTPGGYFQEKWRNRFDNRFLSLCVTDIDNDRKKEIIAGSEDKHIYILDAHGKIIWQHNHKYRIFSIYSGDIDNDGVPELLIGSEHDRVRAMRIRARLPRGLEGKIRKHYRRLVENEPITLLELNGNERNLLEDLVHEPVKEHITLKQAQDHIKKGELTQALSTLLKLQQNKVEQILHKDSIGHIRTVCFRHIANDHKQEIIVVNTDGDVRAFNASGRYLWSAQLDDHILDVQTGFIDHHRQEEIVACSSDRHVYILSGTRNRTRRDILVDTWMSSICVTSASNNTKGLAEIIIGSEDKKLHIYESNLDTPVGTIDTPEGIRIVRAHMSHRANEPEIIAASLGMSIYAYSHSKTLMWEYETKDHIRSICIKDIDADGKAEVLVGSEDRNIHVIDSTGHLLWRFYFPHSALSIEAVDVDQDGKIEILVGCADGYLYIFNSDGDLLWKYQAHDRIQAVRAADIDNDGNVEIAIGSEDELELLRVVDQQQIQALINQCWSVLCQMQPAKQQAINDLLQEADPLLKAFALNKYTEQHLTAKSVDTLQQYAKDDFIEVRKMLICVVMNHYTENIVKARQILYQLSADADGDVKNTVIDHLLTLVKNDWELGFHYLKRFLDNSDRCVRRIVVRKLHQLIDTPVEKMGEKHREIFDLLLIAVQDKESEWIRQEAARALAHYLNSYHGGLIIYVHLFIVKGIQPSMLERVAYTASVPVVKHYIEAVIPMLSGLNDENALERTQQVVKSLEEASALLYGRDTRILYAELYRLLNFNTIEDIASYRSPLKANQFPVHNDFAALLLTIFEKLSSISRTLKIYLWRDSVQDRLSSLLETIAAIEKMGVQLEQYYSMSILGEPASNLPDHYLFTLLLKKWHGTVLEQLNKLRGRAELKAELQTKYTRNEDQVGIWFTVSNVGSSSATSVQLTLLHSDQFDVVETKSFKIEAILPREEKTLEFIIKPHAITIDLILEIVYDDVAGVTKMMQVGDRLELKESRKEFHRIPNPYSTGTPSRDDKMFYGREADMDFLKDNLTRSAKTVIVLYGQRRSGKTTMLLQLINTFALEKHIPVLIDMQRLSYRISINSFLYKVALSITQALRKKGISICQPELVDFAVEPTLAFDTFLDGVEAQLSGQKLILMIDEFEILEEQVHKGKLQAEIFEYLRDILQHRPSINFLFSGTHKITEYTKWYRSVFFNIARHHRLSKLNPLGAEDLIQKPVEGFLEYEPFAVKKIHQLTAYQPYLIHLLCRAIIDYCNEKRKVYVTINDINIVLREVMLTGQFHFDWLWDQIKPEDRIALSVLAEGEKTDERWLSLAELEDIYRSNGIPFTREYLRASLKTLIEADFIESGTNNGRESTFDSSHFRIPVGLTREWLLKERPLEIVRKELSN